MKFKNLWTLIIVLFCITMPATTVDASSLQLTVQEKKFIKSHPKIILGIGKWAPYAIDRPDGTVTGYDAAVLNLINNLSGANFQLTTGDWGTMQKLAKTKKIDGLSNGIVTIARKEYLNLSDSYVTVQKLIFTTKENPANIHTIEDLENRTIGIHKSNLLEIQRTMD